jgi:hypothetical protein
MVCGERGMGEGKLSRGGAGRGLCVATQLRRCRMRWKTLGRQIWSVVGQIGWRAVVVGSKCLQDRGVPRGCHRG